MTQTPPYRPIVLKVVDNRDGSSNVTISTANYGQATVVVRNDQLDTPETQQLYEHAANLGTTAYSATRRSRRDEQRQGG